jgi:hypothetical protein
MYKFIILNIFSLLIGSSSLSAKTTVLCKASDYKNDTIYFYKYSDLITQMPDTVATVYTDNQGAFSLDIDESETIEIYTLLEVYKASMFIDPHKELYSIVLPEKRKKTIEEELNVFFKPIEVTIGIIKNPANDINPLLASFDDIYRSFSVKNYDSIYYKPNSEIIRDFENKIASYYENIENNYFKNYRQFQIAELYFLGPNRSVDVVSEKFFNQKPYYGNVAYMRLFNMMFANVLRIKSKTKEGVTLMNLVKYSRSPQKIEHFFLKSDNYSDTNFVELILLKGIYDEFTNKHMPGETEFPKAQLFIVLDSLANYGRTTESKKIAQNIKKVVSKINNKKTIESLNFVLPDLEGNMHHIDEFVGKYVYLNFVRSDVIESMDALEQLINFNKKHEQDIHIVSVFTDKGVYQLAKHKLQRFNWTLLYINDRQDIIDSFNVITWPQFHLIDPYGKLILSPAQSLDEHFEASFFSILNSRE